MIGPGFCLRIVYILSFLPPAAPKITICPPDQSLLLNERFSVTCAFNGVPPPAVVWKCNSELMADTDHSHISSCSTSSVLEIKKIQYKDEGEYTCIVSNSLGLDSVSMSLHVQGNEVLVPHV